MSVVNTIDQIGDKFDFDYVNDLQDNLIIMVDEMRRQVSHT
jgi:hypothetical protein